MRMASIWTTRWLCSLVIRFKEHLLDVAVSTSDGLQTHIHTLLKDKERRRGWGEILMFLWFYWIACFCLFEKAWTDRKVFHLKRGAQRPNSIRKNGDYERWVGVTVSQHQTNWRKNHSAITILYLYVIGWRKATPPDHVILVSFRPNGSFCIWFVKTAYIHIFIKVHKLTILDCMFILAFLLFQSRI